MRPNIPIINSIIKIKIPSHIFPWNKDEPIKVELKIDGILAIKLIKNNPSFS